MKKIISLLTTALALGVGWSGPARAAVTVQQPNNVVGTGANQWAYLLFEGESFESEVDENPDAGFSRVDKSGALTSFLENPILGPNSTASGTGALFTKTIFGEHVDKVTYKVQFAVPGKYYLYMRFTMFENGSSLGTYGNEDSFFVPPDFGKDPQTDWELPRGGYAEGCCDVSGYLFIKDAPGGARVSRFGGDDETRAYWEGNFHWNELISSQYNIAETSGEPNVRFEYEITPDEVGKELEFTISYREGGTAIDLFLFSTNPSLMDTYTQGELDGLFGLGDTSVAVQKSTDVVTTGTNTWSYLVLEGEDYDSEVNDADGAGFGRVDKSGSLQSLLENPILATNSTASGTGALFTHTVFGEHVDKASYKVQFANAGKYYLYMRFTMFENGGSLGTYGNEDSFFVPPDFGKDPQTDWEFPRGGYTEGCCDVSGYLFIKDAPGGTRVSRFGGDDETRAYWEGNFHWNELISSQYNIAETSGEPNVRFEYEITPDEVGKVLDFTISYREGSTAIDLLLFSTNPNLMDEYTQADLDRLILGIGGSTGGAPQLAISRSGSDVVISWPGDAAGYALEGNDGLSAQGWTPVATAAVLANGQNTVTVSATGTKFYRLRKG